MNFLKRLAGDGFACQSCGAVYAVCFNFCPDCGHKHGDFYAPGTYSRLAGLPVYSQSPAVTGDITTPSGEPAAGKTGPEVPSPPPAPKTPEPWSPGAGSPPDRPQTATVENLSPYLGDYNTLPRAAFDVWRNFNCGAYPPTSTTRLNALRALTPEQLGQLLEACKK